jgi:hypothetical protein
MYEKQIRKACLAIGTRFLEEYVDASGIPTGCFFECIARCLGGIKGYRSMPALALASCIAVKLEIQLSFSHSKPSYKEWFSNVTPALARYFYRPDNINRGQFLPSFPDPEGEEGRITLSLHKKIERNAAIVRRLKALSTDRDTLGFIFCAICRVAPGTRFGVEIIEAHHVLPVSKAGIRIVKAEDFILICPNCHSSIHAGARVEKSPAAVF